MSDADLFHHAARAVYLVLIVSLPALVAASLVGLLFALLQALTQLQEQTLSFTVKLVATCFALALTLRWMGVEVRLFAEQMFEAAAMVGR